MSQTMRRYVGRRETMAFGIANGGQTFGFGLVVNFLNYFYINIFRVDPKIVALLLFMAGIWDIVNNPLMGVIIDKTRTRYGKLQPFLRAGLLPQAAATCLLFAGPFFFPNASPTAPSKVLYMFVTYFVWEMCYTVTDVSFWGLSAALSPTPDDRARAITSSSLFSTILGSLPYIIVLLLMDAAALPGSRVKMSTVFLALGLIAGTIGMGIFSLAAIFVRERLQQSEERPNFRESLSQLVTNKPLRLILTANLIWSLCSVGYVFAIYYYTDVLGRASIGLLTEIPGAVLGFVSYAFVPFLRKRMDSRQTMLLVQISASIAQMLVFAVGIRHYENAAVMVPVLMLFISFITLFTGVMSVVPGEMMAQATDYSEWKTGKRSEGISFSMRIVTTKINGTISQSIGALALAAIGYVPGGNGVRAPQPQPVRFRIFAMFILLPAIIRLIGTIPYFFYDLVGEKRDTMLRELTERRKAAMAASDK